LIFCNYLACGKHMPPKYKDTKLHQRAIENNRDNDFDPIPLELDEIGKKIVHAAYLVHKAL